MATQEDLEGRVEFPWALDFTTGGIKRAVSQALGGAEVQEVKLFPELGLQSWEHGSAVPVRYLLANGTTGSVKFVIFIQPRLDGITVHFEAQTITEETPS